MTIKEHIAYWRTLAERDLGVARDFLAAQKNLHYCLYFGHMSLEKLLKGLVVQATGKTPPKIHNLLILAEKAQLPLDDEKHKLLDLFNSFNLEARYPDYKLSFYRKCTPSFTREQMRLVEEVYQWLETKFQSL
ncbi:MAG: HEPN domain-containing protein [Calditrichaeota bacterium]|nr:MAG: HEPN domain-containing protein [Calditrichota bacterium]